MDNRFEYLGSAQHEVLTPVTERASYSLAQAISQHTGALCMVPEVGSALLSSTWLAHCQQLEVCLLYVGAALPVGLVCRAPVGWQWWKS